MKVPLAIRPLKALPTRRVRLKPKYDRKLREEILRETEKIDEFRELLGQLQNSGRFLRPVATLGAVGGAEVEPHLLRNFPTSAPHARTSECTVYLVLAASNHVNRR